MHIAYIHQHFTTPNDCGGTRSYEFSKKLIKSGHEVTLLSGSYERQLNNHNRKISIKTQHKNVDGINVLYINEPYSNKMNLYRRAMAFRRFANLAYKYLLDIKPGLIFASSTPLTVGLPAKKASKKLKVPFIFEVRDLWPELIFSLGALKNPLAKFYLTKMERSIYKAADHIIALAPGIKDGICKTGYPNSQVTLIPNFCNLELFKPDFMKKQKPQYGNSDDIRFVFTGAHGIANGLNSVIDGINVLKKCRFKGVHFIFIGDGTLKKKLIQRSIELRLEKYITWVDFINKIELANLLPQMDVGMMILANIPAFYYGTSPNKFFDYLACGLPILTNYPGWIANLLQDYKCGIFSEPNNPYDFSDKVIKFCRSPKLRIKMGENSRKLAETYFSKDILGIQFISKIEEIYR